MASSQTEYFPKLFPDGPSVRLQSRLAGDMAVMEKRMSDGFLVAENRVQTLVCGSFRPMVLEGQGCIAVEFMS